MKAIYLFVTLLLLFTVTAAFSQDGECGFMQNLIDRVNLGKTADSRPTIPYELTINTSHFKIHYTLQGYDATTQAWAESTAVYAEQCWIFFNSTGWLTPPPDGTMGGDSLYDIYIVNVSTFPYLGATHMENVYTNPYPDGYTSWIDFSKDSLPRPLSKYNGLRSVVSHELTHAVQARYSCKESRYGELTDSIRGPWFYENTAVYMEDVIYEDVNSLWKFRFSYGADPLDYINLPISYMQDYYPYTGALWPTFLHEYYDSTIVRRIWETLGALSGSNVIAGIDSALKVYAGSSLDEALRNYGIWRFFTGDYADNSHFKEASNYPTCDISAVSYFSDSWENGTPPLPWGPGGMCIVVYPSEELVVDVHFNGQDNFKWAASAVDFIFNYQTVERKIMLNSLGEGSLPVPVSGLMDEYLALISVVTDTSRLAHALSYTYKTNAGQGAAVQFTNIIKGDNAGGKLLVFPSDTVNSGDWRWLKEQSQYTIKTLNERFDVYSGIYKHHDWNNDLTKSKLSRTLYANLYQQEYAKFDSIKSSTIRTVLADAPNSVFGNIQFRDPWYVSQWGTQPDTFYTYNSPFYPTGAYGKTTGGVFLNQAYIPTNPTIPYYSVRAPLTQTVGVFTAQFQTWDSSSGATFTQVGNNPTGYDQKAVKFTAPNAVVKARYKATQANINAPVLNNWNMTSVADTVSNFLKTVVYPTATSAASAYENGGYVQKDTLKVGVGYWIKFGSAQYVNYTGKPIFVGTFPVQSLWNIIGSISVPVPVSMVTTSPSGMIASLFYKYDNGYVPIDTLKPGGGYFVKFNQSGQVILQNPQIMLKTGNEGGLNINSLLADLDKFTITDNQGKQQDLYVRNGSVASELENVDFEMPPPPIVIDFDARFTTENLVEAVYPQNGETALSISLNTDAYPVTISYDIKPENGINYSIGVNSDGMGKISLSQLNNRSGNYVINNASNGKVSLVSNAHYVSRSELPTEYVLGQNYPNPFNPTTVINYQLPENGYVTLKIYDVLGKEVATLVNEYKEAGYYEASFDASRLSSGVYFYKLVAGNFVMTKKMLLAR